MKTIIIQSLITGFLCFQSINARAQQEINFAGNVIDSVTKQPLSAATISIISQNGKTFHEITNKNGRFTFHLIPTGNYNLTVGYIGYNTYNKDSMNLYHDAQPLTINLTATDKILKGITVANNKQYITQTIDKITLNVDASPIAAGSNAYDILLSAPGVIEQNNSIQFRGKSVNVLINGRQSNLSGDDLKNFLSSMPANGIEKIEILPNPSAKYDAQGGSVINIKLAKNKNFGTNGTLTAGIGTGRFGRYNGGISLNHRDKKINIYGSYNYMHNAQYYDNASNRMISSQLNISEDEYEVRFRNNHSAKIGLDYDINKKNAVGFLATGFLNNRDRKVSNTSVLDYKNDITDSFSTVNTNGFARFISPSVNVYYKTILDKKGKELTLNGNYFNYHKKWNDRFLTRYYTPDSTEYQNPFLLRDNSPANNVVKTFTADYVQPAKKGNWEAGLKAALSKTDNNVLWEYENTGDWKTDAGKTNRFIYREDVYAAYINYQLQIKKFSLQAGLRMEHTHATGESVTLDTTFARNYTNLFPNIGVQYMQSPNSQFGINYRKSIQRFGYNIVNPFIVYQSQYSYYQGNPNIKPVIMHSIELSHSWKYQLFTSLSYAYMKDAINVVYHQDDATKLLISSFDNLSSANIYNGTVTWTKRFFDGKWTTTNTAGAFYIKYHSSGKGVQLENAKVTGYLSVNNTFRFEKDLSAELKGYYYSPMVSGVYSQKSFYSLSAGISKTILKKKGNLKLNVTDLFNTQTRRYDVTYQNINSKMRQKAESRFVNLVFTYKFGNRRVKAAKSRKTGIEDEKGRMQ